MQINEELIAKALPLYQLPWPSLSLSGLQSLVSCSQSRIDTWISVAIFFFPQLIETCLYTLSGCLCPLVKFTFRWLGWVEVEVEVERSGGAKHIRYLFKNLSARLLCDFGASFCACLLSLCCALRFILFVKWILPLLLFRFRVQPERERGSGWRRRHTLVGGPAALS